MLLFMTRSLAASMVFLATTLANPLLYADGTTTASADDEVNPHPLASTIRFGTSHSDFIRKQVRDYSCRLIKRERINGKLQEPQFANLRVRCEHRAEDGTVLPLAVYMDFLAPRSILDRRVLYVADKHDGKVLVRKGGNLMKDLKLKVDPFSERARSESKHTITEIGLDKLLDRWVQQLKVDIQSDPEATNTRVSHFRNALVNKQKCTHIQIVHPKQTDAFQFHKISLFVDDKLHVPVRLIVYGWPEQPGGDPPIDEEYNYVGLKLNQGLSDKDFREALLDQTSNSQTTVSTRPKR